MKIEQLMYEFSYAGGINNSYYFTTENQITYHIKFKDTSYLFDGRLDFDIYAFEMVIEIEDNPTGINPPLDLNMPLNIATIFNDFCEKFNQRAIIYICDSSDIRQEARRRKFNQWVDQFKGDRYLKFDTKIKESPQITFHSSLIIRFDNPYKTQIIEAYVNLADEQKK